MKPKTVIDKNSLLKSVVIGMGILVALAVMVGIVAFAPSGKTLASAETVGTAVRPSPPPSLSVAPTTTPEPDAATLDALTLAETNDLEVVRFRPQVQLRHDETSQPATQANKPLTAARSVAPDVSHRPQAAYTAPDIAGIMSPIPVPIAVPDPPSDSDAFSMAMALFSCMSLFMSSKTPMRLLSSIACWTSGGGVMALV